MTEAEIHLKLSKIKIDNDNLDYIKMTGELCGKLRWDLVKLFATDAVTKQNKQLIHLLERLLESNMCSVVGDNLIEEMLKK